MASEQVAKQASRTAWQRSLTFESTISSIIRFSSARITPEEATDDLGSPLPSSPVSPFDLQLNDGLLSSDDSPVQSQTFNDDTHPSSPVPQAVVEGKNDAPVVKISEFRAATDAPFRPISDKTSPKKLNCYILVAPRTIFALSLFTILSLSAVVIGFGVAVSQRQAQLGYWCPTITYCPKNTSYTVLCNATTEVCGCYGSDDKLVGCMKQRYYGQGCYRWQECSARDNLQCNLNVYQCQCVSHYFYNGTACQPLLTYGDQCSSLNDRCDPGLNLACQTTNRCLCDTSVTFWNGESCESYRSVSYPCDPYRNISGCSQTFLCDNTTATCQCPSSSYFDGQECLAYSSYLEPCYDSSSCLPNTQLFCSWGLCQCDDLNYYWSPLSLTCVYPKQTTYNSSCNYQTGCESDFGLRCINGRCLCEANSYWTPGNYCDFQSQYNEQCATAPCMANTGLVCASNTSTCTCPQYYYWDNYVCQSQRTYTAFCAADNWCRMDWGMWCRNFTCTCSLCTTCFWDGVRCRDCPTSWQIVVSNGTMQPRVYCYLKVDSYVNWNESASVCSTAATSFFGNTSHLVYIDDYQELQDVSIFTTTNYYDIFIGHTNQYNFSQWFLVNGTVSPALHWCTGVATLYPSITCTRILIGSTCVTNIVCYGWTSRYICELD